MPPTTNQASPPPTLPWTAEHLLDALGKLPPTDLSRFLSRTGVPDDALEGLDHATLLETSLAVLQAWEAEAKTPTAFLLTATAALCRASFEAFVRLFWDEVPGAAPLKWNWHISFLCQEAQKICARVVAGQPKEHDTAINISPGTSKSTIFSIMLPAWLWTLMPQARIISASHTDSLVMDLAAKSRQLMRGTMYQALFPEIQFSEEQNAKGHYRNTHGGERKISTVNGVSPLGFHAHVILIDDPIDPKEVMSEASKKAARDFFTSVIKFRKVDKKVTPTILVMQRLGVGDPTDVMLEEASREDASPVRHICLPAEWTEYISPPEVARFYGEYNADAGCDGGGLMDPVRLDRATLKDYRGNAWVYAGQFLQRPVPPGGGLFKVNYFLRRERAAPFVAKRVRVWDRASTAGGGCYTAGVLMALDSEGGLWIEHVVHGQWDPVDRNKIMLATAQRDRSRYGKYEPTIWVEMEGGSSGRDAWLGIVRALAGFHVKELNVQKMGNKDARAEPWATQLAGGNVAIVDDGSWDVNGYVEEHLRFRPDPTKRKRTGGYVDQVDASAEAFSILVKGQGRPTPLRTYALVHNKKAGDRRIIACCEDDLPALDLDAKDVLLVYLTDPAPLPIIQEAKQPKELPEVSWEGPVTLEQMQKEIKGVMCSGSPEVRLCPPVADQRSMSGVRDVTAGAGGLSGSLPEARTGGMPAVIHEGGRGLPPPALTTALTLELPFADIDPADYQEVWDKPVQPYGKKPEELQLTRDLAKRLWSFALKQEKPWQVLVLVDRGGDDGRALSVAMAIADVLRLPRSVIYLPGDDNEVSLEEESPPNQHVFDTVKMSRNLVIT